MAPMSVAASGDGVSGSAVIATRPARAPLRIIVRSALPNQTRDSSIAATRPPAAAMFVLTKMSATALALSMPVTCSCEPPLKPNQPSHRISVPIVASGRLAPGMGWTLPYLPLRAPSRITPASAAAAPVMCTTPEPAKSRKPPTLSQPSPHFQKPCTG